MTVQRDESPWRSGDEAPPTEADPHEGGAEWVTIDHAADTVERSQDWISEQCRAGRLPMRRDQDGNALVPLAETQELAAS